VHLLPPLKEVVVYPFRLHLQQLSAWALEERLVLLVVRVRLHAAEMWQYQVAQAHAHRVVVL
jgi:hypothetical protein